MLACGPIDGVLPAMPEHRVDGGDDELREHDRIPDPSASSIGGSVEGFLRALPAALRAEPEARSDGGGVGAHDVGIELVGGRAQTATVAGCDSRIRPAGVGAAGLLQ
jgi:hypothetical protein